MNCNMDQDLVGRLSDHKDRVSHDLWIAGLVAGGSLIIVTLAEALGIIGWAEQERRLLYQVMMLAVIFASGAIVFAFRRLIDWRAAYEETKRLACTDELTGLVNRRRFLECLRELTSRPRAPRLAIMLIELRNFKKLNEYYGHRVGDETLRIVAHRLSDSVSGGAQVVARIGGDKFGVLFRSANKKIVGSVAKKIVGTLPEEIRLAALSFKVDVSVGIVVWSTRKSHRVEMNTVTRRDGGVHETLLRRADMALAKAKGATRSTFQFFLPDMETKLAERIRLESEITAAIESGQIVPHYQPLIDLRSGAVIGCEILARWQHPKRGLLSPSDFIPAAEATGDIGPLTYALLTQGVKDARTWCKPISISLNWPSQLAVDNWAPAKVLKILSEYEFPAHRLELEITETAVIHQPDDAKRQFESLSNLGIRVALDDFGTGYAGLDYLRKFHVDKVKLDRSYVQAILVNRHESDLVKSLIGLCHTLDLTVTAEGIETAENRDLLRQYGCDIGQGYLFGKPQNNLHFGQWLKRQETHRGSSTFDRLGAPSHQRNGRGHSDKGVSSKLQALDLLEAQVAILDRQGTIIHTNSAWDRLIQGRPTDRGRNYLEECMAAVARGCDEARDIADGIAKVLDREAGTFTTTYPCAYGRRHHWCQVSVRPGRASDEDIGAVVSHTDVTSLQYDYLTGIPNRALFEAQAEYVLETAQQNASSFGLLFLDLDGFKRINDEFGHAAGDSVLTDVAKRLRSAVGDEFLARLGGDEFGIVTWVGRHCSEVKHLINDVDLVMKMPFDLEGKAIIQLSASVGAALYPDAGNDLERLLKAADERMYARKRSTSGTVSKPRRSAMN